MVDFDVFDACWSTDRSRCCRVALDGHEQPGFGGDDEIIVGDGEDFVIAGVGDDKVNYEIARHW